MALDADCYNGLEKQRKEQAVQVLQKWSRSLRVNQGCFYLIKIQ